MFKTTMGTLALVLSVTAISGAAMAGETTKANTTTTTQTQSTSQSFTTETPDPQPVGMLLPAVQSAREAAR